MSDELVFWLVERIASNRLTEDWDELRESARKAGFPVASDHPLPRMLGRSTLRSVLASRPVLDESSSRATREREILGRYRRMQLELIAELLR